MIAKNLRWLAAGVMACNMALLMPAPLMASPGQQAKKIPTAPTNIRPAHPSSIW